MSSVLQDWVMALNWKQQSILLSSLRGPDVSKVPNIKIVNRWMRAACQHNADTSKNYMAQTGPPEPLVLCEELEFLPCHFVHHFADGLAVIAYNCPDESAALQAAVYHYRIAEELFHFRPEPPEWFPIRHADRLVPSQENEFLPLERDSYHQFMRAINARFDHPPA